MSQFSGYWSKKSNRSFWTDFTKASAVHYQSPNFDFLPSLLSMNSSATFVRSSLSVKSLWICKIKRWFNRLFVVVEGRQVLILLRDENDLLLKAFVADIIFTKIIFTSLITSATNILLIISSLWNKAIISESCILLSRP